MGKNLSMIIGLLVAVVGLVLLLTWSFEFMFMLRAVVPCLLILGGAVSVIAGITELKDTTKQSKENKG
ncbi:MAG TPA: hypothetical protein PKY78_02800 [Candidatus Omnitrophota bacterium]|nr:hypothetical protein [Candidatus Omnitrophota bacterium]